MPRTSTPSDSNPERPTSATIPPTEPAGGGLSRRALLGGLAGAAAIAAAQWTPAGLLPADAAVASPTPPNFPAGITLGVQQYKNWSGEMRADDVWTAVPARPADVVVLANWARANGYRLRPRGMSHNWSPILIPNGADTSRTLMVDTTRHLTSLVINAGSPTTVTVEAGCSVERLLTKLEEAGRGMIATTAPGKLSVGGVLAIGAHGSGIPTANETRPLGGSYGTLSNLVLSLTAVVWSTSANAYVLKTFQRNDPEIGPFLVHLGRAFVTEVTLQTNANQRLRCQNFYHDQIGTLLGPPGGSGKKLADYIRDSGRVEVIWFPFTTVPWLKVWSVAPSKPWTSSQINSPYPYTFANFVTEDQAQFLADIQTGNVGGTEVFTNAEMAVVGSGLIVTWTWDVWGWSKNTQLFVEPTTLRIHEGGWAVLTTRANVQRVLNEFFVKYTGLLNAYKANGQYPCNSPIELRVTGVDRASEVATPGAVEPTLSAARPRPDHPEWDTVVWLDVATLPGTPTNHDFYRQMDSWIWGNYTGNYACVRPEWSKGWAYGLGGAWTDTAAVTGRIPDSFRTGLPAASNFDAARATFNKYDPSRIFGNPFLDVLLP
ncbi:cholesterol oxidase substrate-binding domain-containing protein [Embleya sp. NBC_00896]|uniref:cholesterol oxidase substrate-binding domain-containing protein n=1 Tax=Embleya sp. NBC_00896 TaxID=2975961 RepID=UPI003869788E|nr:FAD-binding protein [Embleya sp. NBC_00896]